MGLCLYVFVYSKSTIFFVELTLRKITTFNKHAYINMVAYLLLCHVKVFICALNLIFHLVCSYCNVYISYNVCSEQL